MLDPKFKKELKEGDVVVCITKYFQEFTYGKQYRLYTDMRVGNSILPIESDLGNLPLPAYYSPYEYYFLRLEDFRQLQIQELLYEDK